MISSVVYTVFFWLNVVTFWLYGDDKRRAVYGKRRISEKVLLTLAAAGGAYGAAAGMWLFRHKTRHRSFLMIVPACLLLWLAAAVVGIML